MMFLLIAATAPPGKEFVGIVSEYVHGVSHNEAGVHEEVRAWAMRTWAALKRTAKAGSRQTVRSPSASPVDWTADACAASHKVHIACSDG